MDHREQQPQVAGHRRLQREQRLDLVLDGEEVPVDLVVEGDHLVGELAIPLLERAHRAVDGADDALPHLLELGLDLLERVVDRHRASVLGGLRRPRARGCHHFVSTSQRARIPRAATDRPYVAPRTPEEEENQMPRNGKFVRITLALAAVGLVAALAVDYRRRGVREEHEEQRCHAERRRQLVRLAARAGVDRARSSRHVGFTLHYSAVGSGGGIAAITGRTVDFGASDAPLTPDQFSACKGCVQIPWALAATSVIYNLPGVKNLLHMDWHGAREDLSRQDHELERPGDQEAQPGRRTCPTQQITVVHRSDGSGTTYNFTDYLSRSARRGSPRSGRAPRSTGRPARVQPHSSGVAGVVTQTPGGDRLRRRRVRGQEPPAVLQDEEPVRQVRPPGFWQASLAAAQLQTHAREGRLALDRQPAEVEEVPDRLSDLDLHVRDCSRSRARSRRAPEVPHLGDHEGTDLRAEAALPADPEASRDVDKKTIKKIHS